MAKKNAGKTKVFVAFSHPAIKIPLAGKKKTKNQKPENIMKDLYTTISVEATGFDLEICAHYNAHNGTIFASIGDYTSATWEPQGELICKNRAPSDYGKENLFGQKICDIDKAWWMVRQTEILAGLFGSTCRTLADC